MKTNDYIRLGAISLLSHLAQGAAFVLLFAAFGGTGAASSFPFAPPVGLVLGWGIGRGWSGTRTFLAGLVSSVASKLAAFLLLFFLKVRFTL